MGNRANFVVIDKTDWRLYYAHWAGCRMLDALIGGPDLALRYIDSLRACPKQEWVDPMLADGGALIDLVQRRLLFFGDELMIGMPERRAMLAVLPVLWPGYRIEWAYNGPIDLTDAVGARPRFCDWEKDPTTKFARNRTKLCQVVSVRDEAGGLRLWPLHWTLSQAWHGPALLDRLPGPGVTGLKLGMIPEGGVHVDLREHRVGQWHTADAVGICRELPDRWPGWQTQSWGDGFEEQQRRCGPALRLPELDLAAGAESARAWIQQRVYQGFADSPAGMMVKLVGMLAPGEPQLAVGLDTTGETGTRPSPTEWARFESACAALADGPAAA